VTVGLARQAWQRPPFEAGNTAAVKSGFWASPMLRETDRAEVAEIEASIWDLMPVRSPTFALAVEQLACRVWRQRRAYSDLAEHGILRDAQPAPILSDLSKLERAIGRDLVELGLTPRSAAALGLDLAATRRQMSVIDYYSGGAEPAEDAA